ncbi:MAG: hypothetical protein SGI77_08015 [Pirellulaceae bacterium]|nr:hypothetical protein [Pirellulaceae bacterium]
MSRIINAIASKSNVVANVRDYAVVAGNVIRHLRLHLMTALGKGTTSTRGFYHRNWMSQCWFEFSVMRFGQLALIPITVDTRKQPQPSKRWS